MAPTTRRTAASLPCYRKLHVYNKKDSSDEHFIRETFAYCSDTPCPNRSRDHTLATPQGSLYPIGHEQDPHRITPALATRAQEPARPSTPSYLAPTAASTSRSVSTPQPSPDTPQNPLPPTLTSIFNPPIAPKSETPSPVLEQVSPISGKGKGREEDEQEPEPQPEPTEDQDDDMSDSNNGAVNKPEPFTGERGKSARFLDELTLYFLGNKKKIVTSDDKVTCALSFMRDKAAFFVHRTLAESETLIEDENSTTSYPKGLPTLSEFKKSFIATFGIEDNTQAALNAISACTWSSCQNDGLVFVSTLQPLLEASGLNEIGKIREITRLCPDPIMCNIANAPPLPTTAQGYLEKIRSIVQARRDLFGDRADWQFNPNRRFRRARGTETSQPKAGPSTTRKDGDSRTKDTQQVRRMSDQDFKKHMDEKLCFKCHKPGHRSKDCRFRRTRSAESKEEEVEEVEEGEIDEEDEDSFTQARRLEQDF